MKLFCLILGLALCVSCATHPQTTESYPVPFGTEAGQINGHYCVVSPMEGVQEGVYFFDAGLSKLVLELKEGHYQYWFYSDARTIPEPRYPMTGKYLARGATVQLLHHDETPLENLWTFRKIDGTTTLWRPSAIKAWHEQRGFDFYGVLYPTNQTAEEVWLKSPLKVGP